MSALRTYLELGRVSNLPTVWSNVICAAVLSGSTPGAAWGYALLAFSLFYIAGMYFNDACDAQIDAVQRPERPIPSGRITLARVRLASAVLFTLSFVSLGLAEAQRAPLPESSSASWLLSAVFLLAMIVAYDLYHKQNPASPILMGLCRAAVFTTTALVLSDGINSMVWLAIALIFSWLMGLTWIAKQEMSNRITRHWPYLCLIFPLLIGTSLAWVTASPLMLIPLIALGFGIIVAYRRLNSGEPGAVGGTIALLIACISLIDASLIASHEDATIWCLFAIACFGATLLAQRVVRGT